MFFPDAPAILCLPIWAGGSGRGSHWDTGGYGVHGSGCVRCHAAGRNQQFRIGEYARKRSPSGEYGNTFILWIRLALIRQDRKGGHECVDGGILGNGKTL